MSYWNILHQWLSLRCGGIMYSVGITFWNWEEISPGMLLHKRMELIRKNLMELMERRNTAASFSLEILRTWLLWNWSFTVWCISFSSCLSPLLVSYHLYFLSWNWFEYDLFSFWWLDCFCCDLSCFFLPFPNPVIVITLSPAPAPSQRAGTRTFYHRSLDFLHHLLNASFNCIELPLVCFSLKCVSDPTSSLLWYSPLL